MKNRSIEFQNEANSLNQQTKYLFQTSKQYIRIRSRTTCRRVSYSERHSAALAKSSSSSPAKFHSPEWERVILARAPYKSEVTPTPRVRFFNPTTFRASSFVLWCDSYVVRPVFASSNHITMSRCGRSSFACPRMAIHLLPPVKDGPPMTL